MSGLQSWHRWVHCHYPCIFYLSYSLSLTAQPEDAGHGEISWHRMFPTCSQPPWQGQYRVWQIKKKYPALQPILIYQPGKIAAFGRKTLERKLATVLVGFPACPLMLSRTRLCISAAHTRGDLDWAIEVGLHALQRPSSCVENVAISSAHFREFQDHFLGWAYTETYFELPLCSFSKSKISWQI